MQRETPIDRRLFLKLGLAGTGAAMLGSTGMAQAFQTNLAKASIYPEPAYRTLGRTGMKITVDTNVLVRSVVRDDEQQARAAEKALKDAAVIAVALPTLCEFVRVLRKVYRLAPTDISAAVRALLDTGNLVVNRPAAEAGLAMLDAGGDFADGVIANEGNRLGGETFVSFDKGAVALLTAQGQPAILLNG